MASISLTNMGVSFLTFTIILTIFGFNYNLAETSYDIDHINQSVLEEFGDIGTGSDYANYLGEVNGTVNTDLSADTTKFDIIGDLIATALTPVKIIFKGATFLILGFGKILGFIGIPNVIANYVAGTLTLIVSSIFLFAVVLGRRDRND